MLPSRRRQGTPIPRRSDDGRLLLFRPYDHGARFGRSAEALEMEPFPVEQLVEALTTTVRENATSVPVAADGTLYIRPLQHVHEPRLGIVPGNAFQVLVYACAVGSYFAHDEGLRLRVVDRSRSAAGAIGAKYP